jgi:hypothetical protein
MRFPLLQKIKILLPPNQQASWLQTNRRPNQHLQHQKRHQRPNHKLNLGASRRASRRLMIALKSRECCTQMVAIGRIQQPLPPHHLRLTRKLQLRLRLAAASAGKHETQSVEISQSELQGQSDAQSEISAF